MDLQTAERLARLTYEYKKTMKHAASTRRRLLAFLAECPALDAELRATTLTALQDALAQLCSAGDDEL